MATRRLGIITAICILGLLLTNCASPSSQKQYLGEDLASIQHKFTSEQSPLTDMQKEELWKSYDGKLIKGVAYVRSADKNLFGNYVITADFQRRGEYDFTADLAVFFKDSEKDKLLRLSENEHFAFEGKLARYHDLLGNLDIEDAILITDTQVQEKSNEKTENTVIKTCSKELDERSKSATSLIQQMTATINNLGDAAKRNDLTDFAFSGMEYHRQWKEYRPKLLGFYTWMLMNSECVPPDPPILVNQYDLINQIDDAYLTLNATAHNIIIQKREGYERLLLLIEKMEEEPLRLTPAPEPKASNER